MTAAGKVVAHGRPDLRLVGCQPDHVFTGGKTTGLVVGTRPGELSVWSSLTGALLLTHCFGRDSAFAQIDAADAFAERFVAVASGRMVLLLDLLACEVLADAWLIDEEVRLVRFLPERADGTATLYLVGDSTLRVGRIDREWRACEFPPAMPPGAPLWDGVRCFDAQGSRAHDAPAFVAVTTAGALVIVLGDTCEIHTVTGTSPYRRAVLSNDAKGAVIVSVDEAGMAAVHTRAAAFSPAPLCHVGKRARLLGTLTTVLVTTGKGAAVLWPSV